MEKMITIRGKNPMLRTLGNLGSIVSEGEHRDKGVQTSGCQSVELYKVWY